MGATNRSQLLTALVAVTLVPAITWGAGFALFEHGNRAMAMGGAFTAVADDPSAIFWNPAGIAFQHDRGTQFMGGVTFIAPSQDFTGQDPYPGAGYTVTQEDQTFFPPHGFLVMPLSDRLSIGGGVMTPFGLGTWWPEDHAGRFISKRVDLKLYDLNVAVAYRLMDALALSVGVDYSVAQIDLTRNIGLINPYTQRIADVGQAHLFTDGAGNDEFGWNASALLKLGGGFSAGVLYRSEIDMDMEGEGSFTQYQTGYADFDALVAQVLPFQDNLELQTHITFPDYLAAGLAWSNATWTFSGQWAEMGWSSFQSLPVTFVGRPDLSSEVIENYFDSEQYRFGVEYRTGGPWAFRGGFLMDETPQPLESMSPLLGDGDRDGYSVGLGYRSDRWWTDVGFLWLDIEDRCTEGQSLDAYEGCFDNEASLLGVSFGMTF